MASAPGLESAGMRNSPVVLLRNAAGGGRVVYCLLEAKGAEFLRKPPPGQGRIAFVKGPDFVSIELVAPRPMG